MPFAPSFSGDSVTLSSVLGEELAIAHLSALLSDASVPEVSASQLSDAQWIFQFHLNTCQSNSLLSSCSLRDQARIHAISSHACASAWLRAIPSVSLGLTMSRQEFVCSLWYWLGIPSFASTDSIRCSCGSVVDQFGDHLLGCGHGLMRIRVMPYVILLSMLFFKITVAIRGSSAVVLVWIALVMFIIQTFCMISQLILM